MNKEQLTQLRKTLMTKYFELDEYGMVGPFYLHEIKANINTDKAVKAISKQFERLASHLYDEREEANDVALTPALSILISQDDIVYDQNVEPSDKLCLDFDEFEIKNNPSILDDYAVVTYMGLGKRNGHDISFYESDTDIDQVHERFIISFKNYIAQLDEQGLVLDGINNFHDLSEKALHGQKTMGLISPKSSKVLKKTI